MRPLNQKYQLENDLSNRKLLSWLFSARVWYHPTWETALFPTKNLTRRPRSQRFTIGNLDEIRPTWFEPIDNTLCCRRLVIALMDSVTFKP